jgi:hypothetical protein
MMIGAMNMKTVDEQIRDLVAQIEKNEGNIAVLQSKLVALMRQNLSSLAKESTNESKAELLQE